VACERGSNRGGGTLGDDWVILVLSKSIKELVEGLHGIEVGGHFQLGAVLEVDEPVKCISIFKL
jgi:hypothetical protein